MENIIVKIVEISQEHYFLILTVGELSFKLKLEEKNGLSKWQSYEEEIYLQKITFSNKQMEILIKAFQNDKFQLERFNENFKLIFYLKWLVEGEECSLILTIPLILEHNLNWKRRSISSALT
jgi:hypothetical protein